MHVPAAFATRRARRVLALALGLLAAPLALELGLQTASLFVRSSRAAEVESLVLCQGDSNVFGLYLEPEQAFPGQLEVLLRERAVPDARVANRGVPGKPTWVIVDELESDFERFAPRAVVMLAGINDRNLQRPDAPWQRIAARSRVVALVRRTLGNWSEQRGDLEREAHNFLVDSDFEETGDAQRISMVDRTKGSMPFVQRFGTPGLSTVVAWIEDDLGRAVDVVRSRGATPILSCYFEDRASFRPLNDAIRRAAKASNARLIDPAPWFRQAIAQVGRKALVMPDAHLTELGNAIVARLVFNALVEEGVIGAEPIDPLEPLDGVPANRLIVTPWVADGQLRGLRVQYEAGCSAQVMLSESEGSTGVALATIVRPVRDDQVTHHVPLALDDRFRESLRGHAHYTQPFDREGTVEIALQPADAADVEGELWACVAVITHDGKIGDLSEAVRLR